MSNDVHSNPAVLVVEDEPLIRMAAADILQDEGLLVFEAADALTALRVIDAHPEIQILFSDVNMPGPIDGLELAAEVYRRRPSIIILITSGRQRLANASLPDHGTFLPKPYTATDLVRAITLKLDAQRNI